MKKSVEFYEPEVETISREAIGKLQFERLKWQVKRCYKDSEFYRERFDKVRLKPDDMAVRLGSSDSQPVTEFFK